MSYRQKLEEFNATNKYQAEMDFMIAKMNLQHGHTILDYGCGTGFEARELLEGLPRDSIGELVCFDPSREMLRLCQMRISPIFPKSHVKCFVCVR